MIYGWKSTWAERQRHSAIGRVINMAARFLHPEFGRRLPVSWCESESILPIRLRRSRQNRKRSEGNQPIFLVLTVLDPQRLIGGSSRKSSPCDQPDPFQAFKPKLTRDPRIDP